MDESVPQPLSTPPSSLPWIVLGAFAGLIVFVLAVRWFSRWYRHRMAMTTAIKVTISQPTESTTPASLPAPQNDDRLTAREKRIEEIKKHQGVHFEARTCLYCPAKATEPMPVFKIVRSWFDVVFRRLGVSRMDRWYVDIKPGVEAAHVLCERHHDRARGLMELELAEVSAEGAAFMDKLRRRVQTYETYELDEQLLNDVQEIKRGKPKRAGRALPEPANVRQLKAAGGDKTS